MEETFVGGTHFDHTLHIEEFELSCRDCHFGIVHNPATSTDRMNFCLTCHAEMSEDAPQVNDCGICHEAQLAMNQGAGVEGIEDTPSMMYGEAADMTCTDCHTGVTKGIYRSSASTCSSCHDDEAYSEVFAEWATETDERIEKLKSLRIMVEATLLEADSAKRDTAAIWEVYQKGVRNLKFVRNDGTSSVHNNEYAAAILDQVEADFKQALKQLDSVW
jgi:nitrate/TMAO reductase-like tetraheme cytochrome c subunit